MKVNINKLGEEIICDAVVQADYLNDQNKLQEVCLDALRRGECGVIDDKYLFHQFQDNSSTGHGNGVTGLVIIKESHFHISTWPEHKYVQININTCGHIAKPMIALGHLLYELKVTKSTLEVHERGVLCD